jgi:iron(III) transport system ATP-binding protein
VVQQVGTPMALYERPANLFVASFLGTANIIAGDVVGSGADRVFRVADGVTLAIPPRAEIAPGAKLVFRPQDARIGPGSEGASLTGTITHREFLGSSVRYGVRVGPAEITVDVPFHAGDRLQEVGAHATVTVAPSSLLWLAA